MRQTARGFSLIEIIIAVGAMAVLALGLGSLLKTGFMGQKTIQAQDDARVLTQAMGNILAREEACRRTFGGLDPTGESPATSTGATLTEIKDEKGEVRFRTYPPDNVYGQRGVKLTGLVIGGQGDDPRWKPYKRWDPEIPASGLAADANRGTALVRVEFLQTGTAKNNTGPEKLERYFLVWVTNLNPNRTIKDCVAKLGAGSDEPATAPPGFVPIGNEGEPGRFFIQGSPNPPAHYWAANRVCALVPGAVAHLCTHPEWYSACERAAAAGVSALPASWEWTADFVGDFNNGDSQDAVTAGGHNGKFPVPSCQAVQRNSEGIYKEHVVLPFRCCIDP